MQVFVVSGVVFFIVGVAAASQLRNPPRNDAAFRPGLVVAPAPSAGYSPSQVVAMPQFYLLPALAAISVLLLCCGGGFGTMPSFSAACFGTKFMGLNYGLILSAWGVAGLIGPILIARAKDVTGSFIGTLPFIAAVLSIAVVLPFMTKKPANKSLADARQSLHRRLHADGLLKSTP